MYVITLELISFKFVTPKKTRRKASRFFSKRRVCVSIWKKINQKRFVFRNDFVFDAAMTIKHECVSISTLLSLGQKMEKIVFIYS